MLCGHPLGKNMPPVSTSSNIEVTDDTLLLCM